MVVAGIVNYSKEVFSSKRRYLIEPPIVPGSSGILATFLLGLVPLARFGLLDGGSAVAAAVGLPAVLFGSWLGAFLYGRSTGHHYRRVALGFLLVMAALAAWRAAMGAMA